MPQKKFALIFLLLNSIFINFTFSQKISEVDKIVAKYPKSFDSTEELAQKIDKDFKSDYDKARAIYSWIAFNIKYDYDALLLVLCRSHNHYFFLLCLGRSCFRC